MKIVVAILFVFAVICAGAALRCAYLAGRKSNWFMWRKRELAFLFTSLVLAIVAYCLGATMIP